MVKQSTDKNKTTKKAAFFFRSFIWFNSNFVLLFGHGRQMQGWAGASHAIKVVTPIGKVQESDNTTLNMVVDITH